MQMKVCMVMRGGRTGGSGRDVKWVCTDFLRDTYCVFTICNFFLVDTGRERRMVRQTT